MNAKNRKLLILCLVVFGLAVSLSGFPSQTAAQEPTVVTPNRLALELAEDCHKFNYMRGLTLDEIVRGDGFIAGGKIFPAGTLPVGDATNDPNAAGSIGDWTARGTSTGTLAEHLANPSAPAIFWTQYLLLNDGRGLIGEGWFAPSGANQTAITGGLGSFRNVNGEMFTEVIGTNVTGCGNYRLTFALKRHGPR